MLVMFFIFKLFIDFVFLSLLVLLFANISCAFEVLLRHCVEKCNFSEKSSFLYYDWLKKKTSYTPFSNGMESV